MATLLPLVARRLSFLCLIAGAPLQAQHLPATSPFAFPSSPGSAAPVEQSLEFHGFLTTPEGMQYVIVDRARKGQVWLMLNQRNADLDVMPTRYDADLQTLTVMRAGAPVQLPLRRAKTIAAAMPGVRPVGSLPAPAANQAPTMSATSSQALDRMLHEIQERRTARDQAAAQDKK